MSALLFSTSTIIFLIGLVSEQITSLIYNQNNNSLTNYPSLENNLTNDNTRNLIS